MTVTLVVDEDVSSRLAMRQSLELAGYTLVIATGAPQALRILSVRPLGMMVIDPAIEDGDGMSLIRSAKAVDSRLRVIAVCGGVRRERDEVMLAARALGADGILAKPFARVEFLDLAAQLLDHGADELGMLGAAERDLYPNLRSDPMA